MNSMMEVIDDGGCFNVHLSADQESSFCAQKVIGFKLGKDGKQYYQVKWEPTWEPREALGAYESLIEDYWSFIRKIKYDEERFYQYYKAASSEGDVSGNLSANSNDLNCARRLEKNPEGLTDSFEANSLNSGSTQTCSSLPVSFESKALQEQCVFNKKEYQPSVDNSAVVNGFRADTKGGLCHPWSYIDSHKLEASSTGSVSLPGIATLRASQSLTQDTCSVSVEVGSSYADTVLLKSDKSSAHISISGCLNSASMENTKNSHFPNATFTENICEVDFATSRKTSSSVNSSNNCERETIKGKGATKRRKNSKVQLEYPAKVPTGMDSKAVSSVKVRQPISLENVRHISRFINPYAELVFRCKICKCDVAPYPRQSWQEHYLTHLSADEKATFNVVIVNDIKDDEWNDIWMSRTETDLTPKENYGRDGMHFFENFSNPFVEVCIRCKKCMKIQRSKYPGNWKIHFLLHIPDEEKPFKCTLCGKGFVRSGLLQKHMDVSHGDVLKANESEKLSSFSEIVSFRNTEETNSNCFSSSHERDLPGPGLARNDFS